VRRGASGASAGPSIISCFILCLLSTQGPYMSGETDIQQISRWPTVMTQGKSAGVHTGFVSFAKTQCADVI